MKLHQILGALLSIPWVAGSQPWTESLARMPIDSHQAIQRTNCMELILHALQPDPVVKAILFLPDVANRFYLVERDHQPWTIHAKNLLETVTALTNTTLVQVTFASPFLLLHTSQDSLTPRLIIKSDRQAERLRTSPHPDRVYVDRHWSAIQPEFQTVLRTRLRPAAQSEEAWHFARHNLAFRQLSAWEALLALSLAGDTSMSVHRFSVRFER